MLSKRFSQLIRLFAIISFSYFLASCGDGKGPTPVPGEPCPNDAVVSFDSESYAANAASAALSLSDTCIGNQTVVAVIDNGSESISVDIEVDASGKGSPATILFGATDDATDTIAIKEGDVITATYQGASGVAATDTADITAPASTSSIGIYSETFIDPVIPVSQIINVADFGGKNTVTDEVQAAVIDPLEGVNSLRAVYDATNPPAGGNYNGFVFDFSPALVNGQFEVPDASGGNVGCSPSACDGWTAFEFVNINNTAGPSSGPVSHDVGGTQSLTMFGPFSFDSASGAYQADDTVVAGSTYTATAHVMNWAPDALAADNIGILQLTFWSAPGGQTGGGTQLAKFEVLVDSTDDGTNIYLPPQDGAEISDWTQVSITEVAPAGTASAEIFMLHIQLNNPAAGGSIFWDDVSITKGVTPPSGLGADVSSYEFLRFGLNSTAASTLMDLEVKLVDATAGTASVFLSNYTPTASAVAGWNLYEIPVAGIPAGVDTTSITSLGLYNASSTVTGATSATPTLFDATLYFDDVHFATGAAGVPPTLKGVLIDSVVEGVSYQSATQSGITNNLGEFEYLADEMVTFSVGGIVLGTAKGAAIITAVELTGGADPIDQTATNQLVFLQSIDEDEDPSNGITINAATLAAAATQTLDFTLDSAAFTTAVTAVVTAITGAPAPVNTVVSETTALDNFYVTYVTFGGTDTFPWSFPTDYPPYPGVASFPVDFEDAGGPYYITDFEGGNTSIINNPQSGGTNTSAKVAQMQKFASAQVYGGSKLTLGEIDFSSNPVVSLKVWASREVPVTLVLESSPNVERVATHSGSSTWEELTFDFTGFAPTGVREVTIIFDVTQGGDAAGDPANWTFYYDDINIQASVPISYQLIWSDEFDVDGVPNPVNWSIETGYGDNGWGNNEWQLYTTSPDNIKVEAGNLVITADCSVASTAPENCAQRDGTITSGKVITQDKFSFRYGKVEAKIKLPVGQGAWSAFWMLGENFSDVGWPQTGEIDIVEMFQTNNSDPQTTHFTIHYFDDTGNNDPSCFTTSTVGHIYCPDQLRLTESLGVDYHVFSAEWNSAGITGKIDGIPYFFKAIDPVTMDEFLKEFFLILNVAMGGDLGGDIVASTPWPQIMLVDYVKVYQDVNNSDSSFTIGGGAPLDPLGVYSETNTDPAIAYSEIINVADYGGKNTVTDENSSDTVLEGAVSLKADFISTGPGLNYNGFVFNFGSAGGGVSLTNGTFEAGDATAADIPGATGWSTFETVFTTATDGPGFGPVSHDAGGTQSLKMYGPFVVDGAGGAFQFDNTVVPGTTYNATAHVMNWTGDPLTNLGIFQVTFWDGVDGTGNQLGPLHELFVDSTDDGTNIYLPVEDGAEITDWTELSQSLVAPAGTVSARIFLLHIQNAPVTGGSIFWDDVSLSEAAVTSVDITGYGTLKFGVNTAAASGLMDLEVKMEDSASGAASVFLSAYTPTPSGVSNWDLYEIPLSDFIGVDQTKIVSLGYWNASSTVTGSTAVPPTLLDGTLYFDDIHFKVGGPNLLTNGEFETGDATGADIPGATGWSTFEAVFTNATDGPNFGPVSHDVGGTQSVKMFGPFTSTGAAAGASQNVAGTAGTTYNLDAWVMNWTGDPFGNLGILQLNFLDGGGNPITGSGTQVTFDPFGTSDVDLSVIQDGADISDWTQLSLSAVAPTGTVEVQVFLLHIQTGDPCCAGGSLFWDDVSLRAQ